MNIALRYIYTNVAAIIVTFMLFLLMQELISKGSALNTDDQNIRVIDFVRTDRKTDLITKQVKPEKPPEPVEQRQHNSADLVFSRNGAKLVDSPEVEQIYWSMVRKAVSA